MLSLVELYELPLTNGRHKNIPILSRNVKLLKSPALRIASILHFAAEVSPKSVRIRGANVENPIFPFSNPYGTTFP